jgi:hypothetical protein
MGSNAIFQSCTGAPPLASSLYLFWYINDPNSLFWFMLVYGYFVIGGFGTFAVYLPELFPTPVRATGQGFWLAMTLARIDFDAFSLLQLPNLDRYDFADT